VLQQVKDDSYTVVGIIDAEDTVHPELLLRIDAAFRDKQIRHRSRWRATDETTTLPGSRYTNVLEY